MIKWLLVLLLVANVLFGALLQWGGPSRNPDAQLVDLQMNAQQVRVIDGGQDKAAPAAQNKGQNKGALGVQPVPAACLAWGPFTAADALRAREALAALVVDDQVAGREVVGMASFWVHMPRQKSRADAEKKVAELKVLGVEGYAIVEDDPLWSNAINLGVFADETRARTHLSQLQKAGVRTAVVAERPGRSGTEWLVREPGEAVMGRVLEVKQTRFPDSALGAIECPAGSFPIGNPPNR